MSNVPIVTMEIDCNLNKNAQKNIIKTTKRVYF